MGCLGRRARCIDDHPLPDCGREPENECHGGRGRRSVSLGLPALAAWFAASLLALIPLQRWMTGNLQGLLLRLLGSPRRALMAYAILLFPGVTLHEASHWLAARLLGVRATSVSLLPKLTRNGTLRLGYVQTESVDPVRASLIGAAPLLSGTAALWILGTYVLRWNALGQAIVDARGDAIVDGLQAVTTVPWWGLWLYLAAAISNTMVPSRSDRAAWGWVLVLGAVLAGALWVLGWGEAAAGLLEAPVCGILRFLASAFTATAAMDVLLGAPLWALNVMLRPRG